MNVVTVPAAGEKQEQFLLAQRIPMTRPWPLVECNIIPTSFALPLLHSHHAPGAMTLPEEPNTGRNGGPAQGKEMNDPRQWDVTNSPSGRDKYPWLRLIPQLFWVSPLFPLKCVLPFSINHFRFPASASLLNSFLHGHKNPVTAALSWSFLGQPCEPPATSLPTKSSNYLCRASFQ